MAWRELLFSPPQLAFAPRPLRGELTSSWWERVAAANLVGFEELVEALLARQPALRSPGRPPAVCLDHNLPESWVRALAGWCRLAPAWIGVLDLSRRFPGRAQYWFSLAQSTASTPRLARVEPPPVCWTGFSAAIG